ncbi:hypothetical protein HMPREF0307_02244 [Corynebacterium sp. DNF00584]|nr:hypothetical protein HMPREF0307_02244 [Corynebacterium sp. DNF00584]
MKDATHAPSVFSYEETFEKMRNGTLTHFGRSNEVPLPVILAPTPQEGTQENTVKLNNAADAPKDNSAEGSSSAGDIVLLLRR